MAIGLAWGLLRGMRTFQDPAYADLKHDPSRYNVLTKLLSKNYSGPLADWKPGCRLTRARRKLARRYLREMRSDFLRICYACRLVAPFVEDPAFTSNVVRELVRFHVLYARVQLWILFGSPLVGSVEIERLAKTLDYLQQEVYAALPVN